MAKKKNVADLAQEALNSAALFDEEPTTAEKNSEGEALPEEFFEEAVSEDLEVESSVFLQEEEEAPGFLPEVSEEEAAEVLAEDFQSEDEEKISLEGTELDNFESAEIEDVEFVDEERVESILESILFASDRPVSLASMKMVFKGTNINTQKIKRALEQISVEYAGGRRGVTLEEVPGGYQMRTKLDNLEFLRRTLKARPFKLSGPALEVLAIIAYKQPAVKAQVDEIRGVESGHLLRALMEKNLVCFEGKSELPGRPMQYGTTKKFLEIFGLRNLKELPTLSQIDELLPEGIGDEEPKEKSTLSTITDSMAEMIGTNYSEGEEELMKITEQLEEISSSSEFFEKEKQRQREKRDQEKAQNIREAMALGEEVSNRDMNWLKRYDEALAAGQNPTDEMQKAVIDFENDSDASRASTDATPAPEENVDEEPLDEVSAMEEELPFLGEAEDIE